MLQLYVAQWMQLVIDQLEYGITAELCLTQLLSNNPTLLSERVDEAIGAGCCCCEAALLLL